MRLEQFAMERMQSTWENLVEFNLSESGVHPLTPRELLQDRDLEAVLDQPLVYTQSNGTIELRRLVANLYGDATQDNIQVTNGGSEANYLSLWRLIEPGDEVAMLVPNYMQTWGLVRAFGGVVREWPLLEDAAAGRWRPDLDALERVVSNRTRLIIICTPNNPTGACLRAEELDRIADIARRHGSWVLSDEVYRGAELGETEAASMWGRSDRVIVTGGLSKAYGLPGLRIGWIAAPPSFVEATWSYHDYTTIAPGALSDRLARVALGDERRRALLARTRTIIGANWPLIDSWLRDHDPAFSWIAPEAGAIVYVRYNYPINSLELVTRLRNEKSVLVVPGDHFGMDGYLRLGFGERPEYLTQGLERLHTLLSSLSGAHARA
ncbi:MAG: aminotransferase class I/II-fold pyridoxal phosphate-dependent enzyme [Acidobacteria bacterium]|nr:aminotransferase class I/II-fold pyridoxal phosphate-dependent enzyme [Acidobacteriota bacterium]